jgi:Tfp pilus assembly protein PilV
MIRSGEKQQGMTLIELMLMLVTGAIIIGVLARQWHQEQVEMKVQRSAQSILDLVKRVRAHYRYSGSYDGLTFKSAYAAGLVPESLKDPDPNVDWVGHTPAGSTVSMFATRVSTQDRTRDAIGLTVMVRGGAPECVAIARALAPQAITMQQGIGTIIIPEPPAPQPSQTGLATRIANACATMRTDGGNGFAQSLGVRLQ